MLTNESIGSFGAHLITNGASTETARHYTSDLRQVVAWGWNIYTPKDWPTTETMFAQYLTEHRAGWSPNTTLRKLAAFRSWAKFMRAPMGFLANYKAPKAPPPQPHPIPEGIPGVLAMIMSTRNHRHRALLVLTGLMGLRVGEAVSITPDHIDLERMECRFRGKGDKTRVVPISAIAWQYLKKGYEKALRDRSTLVNLTNSGARKAIPRHGRKAGLSRPIRTHDMRATFATRAYGDTKDLRAVQELLGHADSKTTQVYTGVSDAAKRAAVEFEV